MNPHRAELCGFYGILVILSKIVKIFKLSSGHIQIGCDCDNAINKLFNKDPIFPSDKHYDLLYDMREIMDSLPITFSPKYIKGHLDDTISFRLLDTWSQLNVTCDSLAKDLWNRTKTDPTFYHHSPTQPSLWYKSRRLQQWDPSQIQNLIWSEANYQHWEKSNLFTPYDINAIDWENAGRAIKKLTLFQQLWIPKWSCNFLTVGVIRHQRNPNIDPSCPYCDAQETHRHLLQCPHSHPTALFSSSFPASQPHS